MLLIQYLNLKFIYIGGDDVAAALGECLKYNKSLTTLDLSDNRIVDDGAAALGECLNITNRRQRWI